MQIVLTILGIIYLVLGGYAAKGANQELQLRGWRKVWVSVFVGLFWGILYCFSRDRE
jgi:hypothetical protein